LPDTGIGLLGMLNLHGEILPVVDPRPRLGLPSPRVAPEQRLVKMRANVPFLLWVDGVAEVIEEANALSSVPAQHANPIVPRVMRLGDAMIPMLGPAALEPRGFGR
jgi:chemotaxis signal transduction protein